MELGDPVRHGARGALGSLPHAGRLGGRDQARRVRLVRDRVLRGLCAELLLVAGPWAERAQPRHFGCPRRGRCGPFGRRCRLIWSAVVRVTLPKRLCAAHNIFVKRYIFCYRCSRGGHAAAAADSRNQPRRRVRVHSP